MTTQDSSVPVVVDRVHTCPEATWDRSAGWRPVAGESAVWDG